MLCWHGLLSARKLSYLYAFASPSSTYLPVLSDTVTIGVATSYVAKKYRMFHQKNVGCFPSSKAGSNSGRTHRLAASGATCSAGSRQNCHGLCLLISIYNFLDSVHHCSLSNSNFHFASGLRWLLKLNQTFQFGGFQNSSRIGINSN